MPDHAAAIRRLLARGPQGSRALQEALSLSQPTVHRALKALGDEVVAVGSGRSVFYSLRDAAGPVPPLPVHRVGPDGRLEALGELVSVRPAGFVMRDARGGTQHSEGLPWWLADMRPQGFLGRAFARHHAPALALPPALNDWTDAQVLQALVSAGQDVVGNLLLGERARERFLIEPLPPLIARSARPQAYARLAAGAVAGDLPGSSAGGEQPKFTAWARTTAGPAHVIVKFSLPEVNPVTARWRDLLAAEHLALRTLADAGLPAARSDLLDHGTQRFLEVERFDRVGERGRRALHSLASLDDEFTGDRAARWPTAVRALVAARVVHPDALPVVDRLFAFGVLIGNGDMHMGNLSFLGDTGRPYTLAPAYDMLPMDFAPTSGGALRDALAPLRLPADVPLPVWHEVLPWAEAWYRRLAQGQADGLISAAFSPCLRAIEGRLVQARDLIGRVAD
jgi:hypothetical protein